MNFTGLIVGVSMFLIIGLFHPIVIKAEYFFGKEIWPVFLIFGLINIYLSLITINITISSLLAVLAFTCFWSILELFEQEERVKKGWFPENPQKNLEKRRKKRA